MKLIVIVDDIFGTYDRITDEGDDIAKFESLEEIKRLKAKHILGGLPWIVVDIESPGHAILH
jgi:hypothetical protein